MGGGNSRRKILMVYCNDIRQAIFGIMPGYSAGSVVNEHKREFQKKKKKKKRKKKTIMTLSTSPSAM